MCAIPRGIPGRVMFKALSFTGTPTSRQHKSMPNPQTLANLQTGDICPMHSSFITVGVSIGTHNTWPRKYPQLGLPGFVHQQHTKSMAREGGVPKRAVCNHSRTRIAHHKAIPIMAVDSRTLGCFRHGATSEGQWR